MFKPGVQSPAELAVGRAEPCLRAWERLAALQLPAGGWPFEPGQGSGFAEPTCWALLALKAGGRLTPDVADRGCAFLAQLQLPEGGFCTGTVDREPNWCTSLAVFCLAVLDRQPQGRKRGLDWLLGFEGYHWKLADQSVFAHDTSIPGWPWLAGCHSWIEPTCYATFALKAAGVAEHPRLADGRRLILNRALPSGGWNYGNTKVLGTELRAFPSTTAVALLALAGPADSVEVRGGLRFLSSALGRLSTAWALGWTVLAGRYYGWAEFEDEAIGGVASQVTGCAERLMLPAARLRVHELAVLLLSTCASDAWPFPKRGAS